MRRNRVAVLSARVATGVGVLTPWPAAVLSLQPPVGDPSPQWGTPVPSGGPQPPVGDPQWGPASPLRWRGGDGERKRDRRGRGEPERAGTAQWRCCLQDAAKQDAGRGRDSARQQCRQAV